MTDSIFLRIQKLHVEKLIGAVRHNLREIHSVEHTYRHRIEAERSFANIVLRGEAKSELVVEEYRRICAANQIRPRSNGVDVVEAIVSAPTGFPMWEQYFRESVLFLERYWGCPIFSAVIHLDQSNPHVHILVAPFGNMKRLGSELVGYKGANQARMRAFHKEVGERFGFRPYAQYSSCERYDLTIRVCKAIEEDPQRLYVGHLARPLQEAIARSIQRIAPFMPHQSVGVARFLSSRSVDKGLRRR
jgi:hypothetical protein